MVTTTSSFWILLNMSATSLHLSCCDGKVSFSDDSSIKLFKIWVFNNLISHMQSLLCGCIGHPLPCPAIQLKCLDGLKERVKGVPVSWQPGRSEVYTKKIEKGWRQYSCPKQSHLALTLTREEDRCLFAGLITIWPKFTCANLRSQTELQTYFMWDFRIPTSPALITFFNMVSISAPSTVWDRYRHFQEWKLSPCTISFQGRRTMGFIPASTKSTSSLVNLGKINHNRGRNMISV